MQQSPLAPEQQTPLQSGIELGKEAGRLEVAEQVLSYVRTAARVPEVEDDTRL